jgi:hypothetical protein
VSGCTMTYEAVITRVREKLGCGSERISDAPTALRWSWWPDKSNLQDGPLSDYGVGASFHPLENEFREEVLAIRETLDEQRHEPKLANWQKGSDGAGRKMMQSLNQVAAALEVWENIGVPIRRRNEVVFRIWAPRDVMGSPIIKSVQTDAFINGVAEQTAKDLIEIERLKKILEKWRTATIVLCALLAGVVINEVLRM